MTYNESVSNIINYIPVNEQEEHDQIQFKWLLDNFGEKAYDRTLMFGHLTASAIVVDSNKEYILMCFHNIFKSWAWLGGHCDGEMDFEKLARREVEEETGVNNLKLLYPSFSSIEVLSVDGHIKRGNYIPTHLHYNVTFLFEGDMKKETHIKADENSNVKWIKISELYDHVKNDHEMYDIYKKSLAKIGK